MNFINERYRISQRLEREFAKVGKRTIAFTDTYQVEASEGDSFEQGGDADCAKFNAKGKSGSKFTCPPTQKKGRNQGLSSGSREAYARDNQKLNLTADYRKNQVESPIQIDIKPSKQRCALFAEPNIPCGDAVNFELYQQRRDSQ